MIWGRSKYVLVATSFLVLGDTSLFSPLLPRLLLNSHDFSLGISQLNPESLCSPVEIFPCLCVVHICDQHRDNLGYRY